MSREYTGNVSRRMIGDVDIFDLQGIVTGGNARRVSDYISAYLSNGDAQFGILNVQGIDFIDVNCIKRLLEVFLGLKKMIIYYDNSDVAELFFGVVALQDFCKLAHDDIAVVTFLGQELLSHRFPIVTIERRSKPRISAALASNVIFHNNTDGQLIAMRGIISNLSESGAFVNFLDRKAVQLIRSLSCFHDFTIDLRPDHPFYVAQKMSGEIVRIEMTGNQIAIALRFSDLIQIAW